MKSLVGRERERSAIVRLWRPAQESQGLRVGLLWGEAGAGKSSLLDAVLPEISEQGGAVVHVKFFPQAAASIVENIAGAVLYSDVARGVLAAEPERTAAGVLAALRRVARLRPTLLVLEDVHLLAHDSLRELREVIGGLSDELLSVLVVMRPADHGIRSIVDPHLVVEIDLQGLDIEGTAGICRNELGAAVDRDLARAVHAASAGLPLAVRALLRHLATTRSIAPDTDGQWRASIDADALRAALGERFSSLAEDLAGDLSAAERRAAELLACLGEAFALETATDLLGSAEPVERLRERGIVATSTTLIPPLPGQRSEQPLLVFTHTLLHQHLASFGRAEKPVLAGVVARGLPLYSLLPVLTLGSSDAAIGDAIDADTTVRCCERIVRMATHADNTASWDLAESLLGVAESIAGAAATGWPEGQRRAMAASIAVRRLAIMRRAVHTPEYADALVRALALTRGEEMLEDRLWTLRFANLRNVYVDYSRCDTTWAEIQALVLAHPHLRATVAYVNALQDQAHASGRVYDLPMLRATEQRLNELLAAPDLPDKVLALAQRARYYFLMVFDSDEELRLRLRQLDDLPAAGISSLLPLKAIGLLESIGAMERVIGLCDSMIERYRAEGLHRSIFQCELSRLCAQAALDTSLSDVLARAEIICDGDEATQLDLRWRASQYLTEVGLLRGDHAWTQTIVERFAGGRGMFWPEAPFIQAQGPDDLRRAAEAFADDGTPLAALARAYTGNDEGAPVSRAERIAAAAADILSAPPLRVDDLLAHHAAMAALGVELEHAHAARRNAGLAAGPAADTRDRFRALIQAGAETMLGWLAKNSLSAYAATVIDMYGNRLNDETRRQWCERVAAMKAPAGEPNERTHITMLGAITVAEPGSPPRRLRGARLRTMLGLLVAAEMLDEPLTTGAFRRIAAGDDAAANSRKSTVMAAQRLRDAIGRDLVLTDGEVYRLNMDMVAVDIVEVRTLLNGSLAALRRRSLIDAFPKLLHALESMGDVAFPGLFDPFFNALRSDLDDLRRRALIDVATALLAAGDAARAATLLRLGTAAMPGDIELAELLRAASGG